MITCDKCLEGKHFACAGKRGGKCACSTCKSLLPRDQAAAKRRPRQKRNRKGEHPKYYKSRLAPEQLALKKTLGVLTRLNTADVAAIFKGKQDGLSMSELSRTLGCSRDMVRTVYNCPTAPALGKRPEPPKATECPHCKRPY